MRKFIAACILALFTSQAHSQIFTIGTGYGVNISSLVQRDLNQGTILVSSATFALGVDTNTIGNAQLINTADLTFGSFITSGNGEVQGNNFSVGGTTFVVVGGRVGINTTNPTSDFQFFGDAAEFIREGAESRVRSDTYADDGNLGPRYFMRRARGTFASPTAVLDGDRISNITTQSHDGTTFRNNILVRSFAAGDQTPSNRGALMIWRMVEEGSTNLVDRMFLMSNGNLVLNSTLTVQGNAFSVGGTDLVVTAAAVDIGGQLSWGSGATKTTGTTSGGQNMSLDAGTGYGGIDIDSLDSDLSVIAGPNVPIAISHVNDRVGQIIVAVGNNSSAPTLRFAKTRSTGQDANSALNDNDLLGVIDFQGASGSVYRRPVKIQARVDDPSFGNSSIGGELLISLGRRGGTSLHDVFLLTHTGELALGPDISFNPSEQLHVNGNIKTNFGLIASTGIFSSSLTVQGFYFGDATQARHVLSAVKAVDEAVTSTTLQDDDELVLTLLANTTYEIETVVLATSTSAAVNLSIAWTIPAGSTMTFTWHGAEEPLGAYASGITEVPGGDDDEVDVAANEKMFIRSKGILEVHNTAGPLTFQWAQKNASGAEMKVLKNSYMKALQLN